jgi:hypothetical protein
MGAFTDGMRMAMTELVATTTPALPSRVQGYLEAIIATCGAGESAFFMAGLLDCTSSASVHWERKCIPFRRPAFSSHLLGGYCSRDVCQRVVFPVVARLCGGAGEHPQANAIVIHAKQIREAADCSVRVGAKPHAAIPQVLGRVVRGVADERLRVNHPPRLPARTKDVPSVQVRRQQHMCRSLVRCARRTGRPPSRTSTGRVARGDPRAAVDY